jgi:hypothetical protein
MRVMARSPLARSALATLGRCYLGGKMKNYKGNMGSGKSVPGSGTYGFFHAHSSAREITLLKGRIFPFCPMCSDPVEFVLIRGVPVESALGRFRLLMHRSNISAPNQRPIEA